MSRIPEKIRRLFWDVGIDELDFSLHEDFIIGRVLSAGGWRDICWLRGLLGNGRIRDWILKTEGRPLSKERLRYWELILDLPHELVTTWLASEARQVWDNRCNPSKPQLKCTSLTKVEIASSPSSSR